MTILVSGSIALDHIMVFPDRFKDHILPDKLHILNVSFNIESLKTHFGGVAGNIAYHLRLLGEDPPPALDHLNKIIVAYGQREPGKFNAEVQRYKRHLRRDGPPQLRSKYSKNTLTETCAHTRPRRAAYAVHSHAPA